MTLPCTGQIPHYGDTTVAIPETAPVMAARLTAPIEIERDEAKTTWRNTVGYFHQGTFLRPYRGLICLASLLSASVSTLILTCCWFCLFYNVQVSMPRTFSWELIVQLMGSYFDDCIDHLSDFPVETSPLQQCRYTTTLPWVPLLGAFICLITFCTVTSVWLHRLIRRKLVLSTISVTWKVVLILMCIVECIHFAVGIRNKNKNTIAAEQLRQHMDFTMNRNPTQLPNDIYFRWDVTQARMRCCGIDGSSDWKFSVFRDGNPRYPLSCCNTDVFRRPSDAIKSHYPICKQTRRQIWGQGCLMVELETVRNYQELFLRLLVLSLVTVNLSCLFACLVENYLATAPLFPPEKDFNVLSFFRRKCSLQRLRAPTTAYPPDLHNDNNDNDGHDLILYDEEPRFKAKESHCASGSTPQGKFVGQIADNEKSNNYIRIALHETKSQQDIIIKPCGKLSEDDIKPVYTKKFKISREFPPPCTASEGKTTISIISVKETWV